MKTVRFIVLILGGAFLATSAWANASDIFQQEAVTVPLTQFIQGIWTPASKVEVNETAAMFGRGYLRSEAHSIVIQHARADNWETVKFGRWNEQTQHLEYQRPHRPSKTLHHEHRKARAILHLVEDYYKQTGNPEDLNHLRRLENKKFRFVDKTQKWSGSKEWRSLIFQWESSYRFVGAYADSEAVYLPFPLLLRLDEMHQEAARRHLPRVKHLTLEVMAQILHHEAEHLVNGPGWENDQEIQQIMNKLDQLFDSMDWDYLEFSLGFNQRLQNLWSGLRRALKRDFNNKTAIARAA